MFRFLALATIALFASTAQAQRIFYASAIDVEQNERLDAVETKIDRIETEIERLSVVAKPTPAKAVPVSVSLPQPQPKPVASNYYSQAELIAIVRNAYPSGNYTQYADVQPRSSVWSHLQDGSHQFTASQVNGLPQDIALGLHGLHHANRIRATRSTMQVSVPVPQPTYQPMPQATPQPAYQSAGGCANGRCPSPARVQPQSQQRFRIFPRMRR